MRKARREKAEKKRNSPLFYVTNDGGQSCVYDDLRCRRIGELEKKKDCPEYYVKYTMFGERIGRTVVGGAVLDKAVTRSGYKGG